MGEAVLFGVIASAALVLGGWLGARTTPPQQLTGVLLAFASGSLIGALAFELVPEAYELGGATRTGLGLLAGGAVFVVANAWLDARVGGGASSPRRSRPPRDTTRPRAPSGSRSWPP
jgi:ZIP family zinc transporter